MIHQSNFVTALIQEGYKGALRLIVSHGRIGCTVRELCRGGAIDVECCACHSWTILSDDEANNLRAMQLTDLCRELCAVRTHPAHGEAREDAR